MRVGRPTVLWEFYCRMVMVIFCPFLVEYCHFLFPQETSRADMLMCIFGECSVYKLLWQKSAFEKSMYEKNEKEEVT